MTIFRYFLRLSFLSAALVAFAARPGLAQSERNVLTIVTASGAHKFDVDVMRTEPDLEKGLMYRRSIPANYGMLFDFQHEQNVMMWMKNTYIPLDMVFMDKRGRVVGIIARAEPMSERILSIGVPADAVLELQGGAAEKIGLVVGDTVTDSIFHP